MPLDSVDVSPHLFLHCCKRWILNDTASLEKLLCSSLLSHFLYFLIKKSVYFVTVIHEQSEFEELIYAVSTGTTKRVPP